MRKKWGRYRDGWVYKGGSSIGKWSEGKYRYLLSSKEVGWKKKRREKRDFVAVDMGGVKKKKKAILRDVWRKSQRIAVHGGGTYD